MDMKDKEIAAIIGNKKIEGLSLSSYVDKHDWEKGSVLLVPEDELFSVFKKGSRIELHQMQGKELIKFYATVADVDMPGRHVTVVDLEKIGDKEAGKKEDPAKEKKEAVNHPSHYQLGDLGIEALDVMVATMTKEQMEGFYIGNVQKYTLRAAQKNGLEDFKKALFYLKKLVELMEG